MFKDLPINIKNLSSYLKFGLNNPTTCLARSIGIKGRDASLYLYQKSNNLIGKEFIKWLSNLTNEEINLFELQDFEKDNIQSISLKLTPNSFREVPDSFEFKIKGTYYNKEWRITSKSVRMGQQLNYQRDYSNQFDPYAVLILIGDLSLGFIPRELSKLISAEIDIEESRYLIKVLNILDKKEYNEISVIMEKY